MAQIKDHFEECECSWADQELMFSNYAVSQGSGFVDEYQVISKSFRKLFDNFGDESVEVNANRKIDDMDAFVNSLFQIIVDQDVVVHTLVDKQVFENGEYERDRILCIKLRERNQELMECNAKLIDENNIYRGRLNSLKCLVVFLLLFFYYLLFCNFLVVIILVGKNWQRKVRNGVIGCGLTVCNCV